MAPGGRVDWLAAPAEVWPRLLEPLGPSLGAACALSPAWARAATSGGCAAYRPLCSMRAAPAPGDDCGPSLRHAEVARLRRGHEATGWPLLARSAVRPSAAPAEWAVLRPGGDVPSSRHSVAVCGAPEGHCEAAVLFGGNVSRTVAGAWRTSDELFVAALPGAAGTGVQMERLPCRPGSPWPARRWGASLTSLRGRQLLLGGWSEEGDCQAPWALHLREAGPEWSELPPPPARGLPGLEGPSPPPTAFHTATGLDGGRRVALLGGLGSGGTARGLWIFEADSGSWFLAAADGPSCAGHAAGVVDQRLAIFGGVERERGGPFGDAFRSGVAIFDLRMMRWDADSSSRRSPGPAPRARRNPAHAIFGRSLLVSGGFDDTTHRCLTDTWCYDVPAGVWHQLPDGAPALEGHKALVSGFDVFTLGGHSAPGRFPSRAVSVHALSLGLAECGGRLAGESAEDAEDPDGGESSSEGEGSSDEEGGRRVLLAALQAQAIRLLRERQAAAAAEGSDEVP
ncbi:unnamed protein product [Prorocentrum cordatum]|uniref:Uncharacterized protein n=1 Tax=Prorocentrum cordatum TaxID=2364126 RepID=A0ABN9WYT4_9DINO|nr:unnamed protein product [Polarella glacialis]